MSTTSAADLLAHADQLTRQLRDSDVPISIQHWATFDVTVHRLMFELVGPGAMHEPGRPRTALAPTLAVFRSSPEPLRHPVNTQLSLRQAAALDETVEPELLRLVRARIPCACSPTKEPTCTRLRTKCSPPRPMTISTMRHSTR